MYLFCNFGPYMFLYTERSMLAARSVHQGVGREKIWEEVQSVNPWFCRPALLALLALILGGCGSGGSGDGSPSACAGMTPIEAAHHYKPEARDAGASKRFVELVTEPSPEVQSSP